VAYGNGRLAAKKKYRRPKVYYVPGGLREWGLHASPGLPQTATTRARPFKDKEKLASRPLAEAELFSQHRRPRPEEELQKKCCWPAHGAVGRSTLLASRLLILQLTSRNKLCAPLAREGGGGVAYGNGLVRLARACK
jgi:hypothetical protein